MISIERNKKTKQFFARVTGKNGEKLHNGENVTRKANAMKQLIAVAKEFNSVKFTVVDKTGKEEKSVEIDMGREDVIKEELIETDVTE